MEYASRGDLLDHINSRTRRGIGIGEESAKNLFRQLAEGVAHCHRRNVVHRLVEVDFFLLRRGLLQSRLDCTLGKKRAETGKREKLKRGGISSAAFPLPLFSLGWYAALTRSSLIC